MTKAGEKLFASTTPGLDQALLKECQRLDPKASLTQGGVELSGPSGVHRQANLRLRIASRIHLELAKFAVRTAADLRRGLASVDVRAVHSPDVSPHVEVVLRGKTLPKRLVEEAVGEAWGARAQRDEATIRLRIVDHEAVVSIDTSGELLHRRGYRQEVGHAPLRETLAAGILSLAGYDPSLPLWDPMCGSGTLVIEAAQQALHVAPGLGRSFGFESFPAHPRETWEQEKASARSEALARPAASLRGSDLHGGALGQARRNAHRAGVTAAIQLERLDATRLPPAPGPAGQLVANLPYGKRIGERGEVTRLVERLGESAGKAIPGWRFALLTADQEVEARFGHPVRARYPLDNGGISVVLLVGRIRLPGDVTLSASQG